MFPFLTGRNLPQSLVTVREVLFLYGPTQHSISLRHVHDVINSPQRFLTPSSYIRVILTHVLEAWFANASFDKFLISNPTCSSMPSPKHETDPSFIHTHTHTHLRPPEHHLNVIRRFPVPSKIFSLQNAYFVFRIWAVFPPHRSLPNVSASQPGRPTFVFSPP